MSTLRLGQVTFAELLELSRDTHGAELRVGMPCTIETFDPTTQLASVRPCLRDLDILEDGSEVSVDCPVISDVPCQFPGGGGFSITWPVVRGDPVFCVFADRSLDKWLDSGEVVDPVDVRTHHLTDAVGILGVRARPGALPSFDSDHVTIGRDGGAADFVALAGAVLSALQDIASKFNEHTHTAAGSPTSTPAAAATPTVITAPDSVGSATVKIKG